MASNKETTGTTEEVHFLLAVLEHADVGKINFDLVAAAIGKTNNAARKQLKRIQNKHGAASNTSATEASNTSGKKRKASKNASKDDEVPEKSPSKSPSKKVKVEE